MNLTEQMHLDIAKFKEQVYDAYPYEDNTHDDESLEDTSLDEDDYMSVAKGFFLALGYKLPEANKLAIHVNYRVNWN